MSQLLLCSWSSIMIFVFMVRKKYHWTVPSYRYILLFVFAGMNSTIPASLTNNFLGQHTDFYVFSGDRSESFIGFALGAGFGEEFYKLSSGLLVLLILGLFKARLRPVDRCLGMVTVGLAFATLENLLAYGGVGFWVMMTRGVLAVPLHATMSMIHGVAINKAYENGSLWPLFVGYWVSAILHTLYDTMSLFMPDIDPRLYLYPLVGLLLWWAWYEWAKLSEHPDTDSTDLTMQDAADA